MIMHESELAMHLMKIHTRTAFGTERRFNVSGVWIIFEFGGSNLYKCLVHNATMSLHNSKKFKGLCGNFNDNPAR